MSETLSQKQQRFTRLVAQLIARANAMGYDVTLGEALRSDEQAEINAMGAHGRTALAAFIEPRYPVLAAKIRNNTGSGIRNSLHELKLAIDLNLFKDGAYLSSGRDHEPLGVWWEQQGGSWGGRFGDGNHYALEHEGRR